MSNPSQLRLDNKWFNPLYFHLRKYVEDKNIRKIMVYGGKSSAKTFTISQLLLILGFTQNSSSIAYRKQQTSIKITLKPSFTKAIDSTYLNSAYAEMDFKFVGRDNEIVLKGLDKEGKIKGIEGFRFLLFDELDHFTQDEWTQANLSLRGIPNQKLFATWNPISEDSWIKKELDKQKWTDLPLHIDGNPYSQLDKNSFVRISDDGKTLLIKTTYLDNKWVTGHTAYGKKGEILYSYGQRDENLIHEYEKLKDQNDNNYLVNVLGEWGIPRTGMEYFPNFSNKHIGNPIYYPDLPLHITFDMNVNPYMTMLVTQILLDGNKFKVNVIDEYCLRHPLNKTKYVCEAFWQEYFLRKGHRAGVFYYGDATSNKNNTMTTDEIRHDYDIIERELRTMLNNNSERLSKSNPPVLKRKDFLDDILLEKTPITLMIHEKCKHTKDDFRYLKEGPDGKKFKEIELDPITGAKPQKYGHTSDALEYLLCRAFDNIFRQYERR